MSFNFTSQLTNWLEITFRTKYNRNESDIPNTYDYMGSSPYHEVYRAFPFYSGLSAGWKILQLWPVLTSTIILQESWLKQDVILLLPMTFGIREHSILLR